MVSMFEFEPRLAAERDRGEIIVDTSEGVAVTVMRGVSVILVGCCASQKE